MTITQFLKLRHPDFEINVSVLLLKHIQCIHFLSHKCFYESLAARTWKAKTGNALQLSFSLVRQQQG